MCLQHFCMKKFACAILFSCILMTGYAQPGRYLVQFKDKAGTTFSLSAPGQYLSQRAIERRARYGIAIDSTDLPVNAWYLDSLRLSGTVTLLNISKWLNQVTIQTTDAAALEKIAAMPFVKNTSLIAPSAPLLPDIQNKFGRVNGSERFTPESTEQSFINYYSYGASSAQVKIHKGEFLHNLGFRGEGMQMAIIDAGFKNYLTLPTFDSIRNNNQILGTWDFVNNKASVNEEMAHGMQCLSTIAANIPGTFVGTAPKTSFYLYKTEDDSSEYPIEEHNYATALERADSVGADITSTSLGYTTFDNPAFNYTYADMDGNTSISARAADYAAAKGMLMIIAAGNEGGGLWNYLSTPADADSVLCVGAIDTFGNVAAFSGRGPSSDGQIKPSVTAVGQQAIVANQISGLPQPGNGTSFACPNMAGLATCLWQAFPEVSNMDIIGALQESATTFANPNNEGGYGIPDMKKAFVILLKKSYTQQIQQAGCSASINFKVKVGGFATLQLQRKLAGEPDFTSFQTVSPAGEFHAETFSFSDDLSGLAIPTAIQYRVKMDIGSDTSFVFPAVTIDHALPCVSYSFNGSGNWDLAANWLGSIVPPMVLPAGSSIIIDPPTGSECILNTQQEIAKGGLLIVRPGKQLLISGNLIIQP